MVSIHAPGRGATRFSTKMTEKPNDVSIHAPGRGATKFGLGRSILLDKFQFTHPGGVRHGVLTKFAHKEIKFQFTHPGGVRLIPTLVREVNPGVSIHAPGRGATTYHSPPLALRYSFNSRTREGCDLSLSSLDITKS